MNLYALSAVVLTIGVALTILVFLSYYKRLSNVANLNELRMESIEPVFRLTSIEQTLGYVFIAAIAFLIWQTIKQGFDFALLMISATAFTGVIWLIDLILTKRVRSKVLDQAAQDIDGFNEKVDRKTFEPGLIENSRAFFPILIVVFVLRSFLFEPFQIPSGSMKPTLEIRDFILVNRFTYGIRMPITNKVMIPISHPQRGDVIVFKPPHEPDKNFIKRVIGLPGDLIQYDYGRRVLKVNGQVVERELIAKTSDEAGQYQLFTEHLEGRDHLVYTNVGRAERRADEWLPVDGVVVPEGKYFVMGDNRDNSHDARYWEGLRRLTHDNWRSEGPTEWGFVDDNTIIGKAFLVWMHWEGFYPSFSRSGKIQ